MMPDPVYDVVVVGAGPGGLGAAVAAARQGCRTLVVEKQGFGGGVATRSHVALLMGYAAEGRQVVGGIADELVRRLDGIGEAAFRLNPAAVPDPVPVGTRPLLQDVITSVEGVRITYNRMLADAGVESFFYADLCGCDTDGRRIRAITVNALEGPVEIKGRVFIDATGDAQLVHRAGGDTYDIPAAEAMTKSIFALVGGVENFYRPACENAFYECIERGDRPLPAQDRFMSFGSLHPGIIHFHVNAVAGSALTSAEMTRMDRELREQLFTALAWFRTRIPGFADAYIIDAGPAVGVRAGRCIEGEKTITVDSLAQEAPEPEPVCLGTRSTGGAHYITGFRPPWKDRGLTGIRGIPLGALIPKRFENVLAAGRCIAHRERTSDSFRTMARCIALGEAAGVTAALAVQDGCAVPAVGYVDVRRVLLEGGAVLA